MVTVYTLTSQRSQKVANDSNLATGDLEELTDLFSNIKSRKDRIERNSTAFETSINEVKIIVFIG